MADWDLDLEQIRRNWDRGAQRGGKETKAPPSRMDLDLEQIRKNWERLGLLYRQAFVVYYDDLVPSGDGEQGAGPDGPGFQQAPGGGPWVHAAGASGLAPGEQDD